MSPIRACVKNEVLRKSPAVLPNSRGPGNQCALRRGDIRVADAVHAGKRQAPVRDEQGGFYLDFLGFPADARPGQAVP